jgi:hypothetical protein
MNKTAQMAMRKVADFEMKLASLKSEDETEFAEYVDLLEADIGDREAAKAEALRVDLEEFEEMMLEVIAGQELLINDWITSGSWPDFVDPSEKGQVRSLFRNYVITESMDTPIPDAIEEAKRLILQGRKEVLEEYLRGL